MSDKPAAAASARPGWDKDEWAAKAKARDEEGAEYAKAAEKAMLEGKMPPQRKRPGDDLPKPTKALEARKDDLDLTKNLNKTMLVQTTTTGKGPRGAGFYCEMCNRTFKDTLSYLDHVNGRGHLRMLGQTTQVARSTLTQVREKIASLRAQSAAAVTAKNFDFAARLKAIREAESDEKDRRKEERKRKKEKRKHDEEMRRMGVFESAETEPAKSAPQEEENKVKRRKMEKDARRSERAAEAEVDRAVKERDDMAAMMGFGGFGSSKK
ncbi:hypothetical protein IAU60_000675 [Kwoniella sp. DSM 27419]